MCVQLDEMHGVVAPARGPNIWGLEFGNASSMHGYDGWYFHEKEDLPLTEEELLHDWKPPEWALQPSLR